MLAARLIAAAGGAAVVAVTLLSAIRTVVVPRAEAVRITRAVFRTSRKIFNMRVRAARTYERRDRAMALFAPLSLMSLPLVWLVSVASGYAAMFWAVGVERPWDAIELSGSSLLTLGFVRPDGVVRVVLAFSEAALGLSIVTLMLTFLPSMYAAFSRRELSVGLLQVRAGNPPTGVEMILRYHGIGLDQLREGWLAWETWFVDLEETHTSFGALTFFRSPQPDRSWVTAAGAVLDGAALSSACLSEPQAPNADLCLRAGFLSLRRIADFFDVAYDADPQPDDPISVTRDEFDEAYGRLAAAGVPMRADADRAWRDFSGWRVNYDTVLLALAAITAAPYAPWSSDRSAFHRHRRRLPRLGQQR